MGSVYTTPETADSILSCFLLAGPTDWSALEGGIARERSQRAVLREFEERIDGNDPPRLPPGVGQQSPVAHQISQAQPVETRLPRSGEVARTPDLEVGLRHCKSVSCARQDSEAIAGLGRRTRPGEQQAVGLELPPPNPATQLMEL